MLRALRASLSISSRRSFSKLGAMSGAPTPKLIALDGNGTLLKGDGTTISEYTRDVILQVQARGIPVVLVTGRSLDKARPMLERAGMQQYAITENGARAVVIEDGSLLYELWIDGPVAAAPVRAIKEKFPSRCFFVQLTKVGGWIESTHPWLADDAEDATREGALKMFVKQVPELETALLEEVGVQCAKSYVTVPDSTDFAATMAEIKSAVGEGWAMREIKQLLPGIRNTCEVQSTSVNKADGLAGLCRTLGVPLENVWAFGDDHNDVRMLSEMGWGVRMANHVPAIASVGKDVTPFSNDDDGVAKYLEEWILKARDGEAS